jgi:hypothetical protein
MKKENEGKEDPIFNDIEDEPTPYGVGPISSFSEQGTPVVFIATIGVVVLIFVIAGAFVASWNPALSHAGRPEPASSGTAAPAATPVVPEISTSIQHGKNGTKLFVQWTNLPDGTTEINIFYAATTNGTYHLIGSIPVGSIADGSGSLTISAGDANGSFYGVASTGNSPANTNGTGQGSGNNGDGNTSSGDGTGNSGSGNGNATGSGNGVTPPAGNDNGNGNGDNNGSSTQGTGNANTSTAPVENFLVQHFDEKIQISWQVLPLNTFEVVVSRSASDSGPWTPVLTETNIASDGPYSIEVVDDTLGDPYYYKMDTYDQAGDTITTYGPILLAPL